MTNVQPELKQMRQDHNRILSEALDKQRVAAEKERAKLKSEVDNHIKDLDKKKGEVKKKKEELEKRETKLRQDEEHFKKRDAALRKREAGVDKLLAHRQEEVADHNEKKREQKKLKKEAREKGPAWEVTASGLSDARILGNPPDPLKNPLTHEELPPLPPGKYPPLTDAGEEWKDHVGILDGTAGNQTTWIGGDSRRVVVGDSRSIVAGEEIHHVSQDQTNFIRGNQYEEVDGDVKILIKGKYNLEVVGKEVDKKRSWQHSTYVLGKSDLVLVSKIDMVLGAKLELIAPLKLGVIKGWKIEQVTYALKKVKKEYQILTNAYKLIPQVIVEKGKAWFRKAKGGLLWTEAKLARFDAKQEEHRGVDLICNMQHDIDMDAAGVHWSRAARISQEADKLHQEATKIFNEADEISQCKGLFKVKGKKSASAKDAPAKDAPAKPKIEPTRTNVDMDELMKKRGWT